MTVSINELLIFVLILVRISGFIYTAPFFSLKRVPIRVKAGLAFFIALMTFMSMTWKMPIYNGTIGFGIVVVKEAITGTIMGLFANIAYHIIAFAGQMIDMSIGFSMVNELDPVSNIQITITANLYGYVIILFMMITNLHHYFIVAIVDSFKIVPIGGANFNPLIYKLFLEFITNYFVIGFRIIFPIFSTILIVNAILAILAKIAPQMNMFVIGMQLKVFVGLVVLSFIITLVPSVADFIFNEMIDMLRRSIEYLI